jgi:hypothetical protein
VLLSGISFSQTEPDNYRDKLLVTPGNKTIVTLCDSIHKYTWDSGLNDWKITNRNLYLYNENGKEMDFKKFTSGDNGISWSNYQHTIYEYNVDGDLVFYNNLYWNADSLLWESRRQFNSIQYNSGRIITDILYVLDRKTYHWYIEDKDSSIYDEQGNLLESIIWRAADNLILDTRTIYSYGTSDDTITIIKQNWDTTASIWINYISDKYLYTIDKFPLLKIGSYWDKENEIWILFSLEGTLYDEKNNYLIDSSMYWNESMNRWIGSSKREFIYNSEGLKTDVYHYDWSDADTNWYIDEHEIYFYDQNNYLKLKEEWSFVNNKFDLYNKVVYACDSYGNIINETSFALIDTSWLYRTLIISEWDNNGNQTEYEGYIYMWVGENGDWQGTGRFSKGFDEYGNEAYNIEYFWNPDKDNWDYRYKSVYFVSIISNETHTLDYSLYSKKLEVLPNPSRGILNIDLSDLIGTKSTDLYIYDITGKLVYQKKIFPNGSEQTEIDISNLKEGVYILRVNTYGLSAGVKIFKE